MNRSRGAILLAGVLALAFGLAGPVAGFWTSGTVIPAAGPPLPSLWGPSPPAPELWSPAADLAAPQSVPRPLDRFTVVALSVPDLPQTGDWTAPDLRAMISIPPVSEAPLRLDSGAAPPALLAAVSVPASTVSAAPPAMPVLTAAPVDPPSPIQINGVLMYRLFNDPYPPVAGGANLNALTPTPTFPTVHDGILETAINWTLTPNVSLWADLSLESTTGEVSPLASSDIEEAYLDLHNLGFSGFGMRVGRDRIKLGVEGLLLDENVYDGGRRDGIEARMTQLGPVSLLGFVQYSLDDGLQVGNWSSSRRVWGGVAAAQIVPGWTVDVAYRADTAAAPEVGPCPGIGCNVGTGWSVGLDAALTPAVDFTMEAATYTQMGDVARWYYEPTIALDLQQLLGLPGQPLLTFWYKSFDPYTAPLDAPLGHELLPGDFSAFNTNDNLTGFGGELDVTVTPVLGVFFVGEAGTYKGGGPNYSVYSIGAKYSLWSDTVLKVSYNGYLVDGGVVTTSPISGLQLSNAQILLVELTKTF
jgi:hypothetical protein